MANLKELRGRIKSVASIAQITRAMEMVASMKMRKVQGKAQSFHPYTEEIRQMIDRLDRNIGFFRSHSSLPPSSIIKPPVILHRSHEHRLSARASQQFPQTEFHRSPQRIEIGRTVA